MGDRTLTGAAVDYGNSFYEPPDSQLLNLVYSNLIPSGQPLQNGSYGLLTDSWTSNPSAALNNANSINQVSNAIQVVNSLYLSLTIILLCIPTYYIIYAYGCNLPLLFYDLQS